jgi:hypothetical protein
MRVPFDEMARPPKELAHELRRTQMALTKRKEIFGVIL